MTPLPTTAPTTAPPRRALDRPAPSPPARRPPLRSHAIGMGWLPEQAGGLNRMFYNLAEALPRVGVGVRGLVAGQAAGGAVSAFARTSTPLPLRMLRARTAIRQHLLDEAPDLVASHFALYTAPALDRLGRFPLVVHFHGPWAAEGSVEGASRAAVAAKRALERAVYQQADRFVVLSDAFRRVLVETYGVSEALIRIVPGGVEARRFALPLSRAEARERLGWPTDRPVVLAVRRLAPRMGLDHLITAVATVRRSVPDVLVLIAGRGPQAEALQAQVDAAGLGGHVRLLGFVPDDALPLAYRAADLSVVPTVALEGFGLIAAESLAAGTPVLVSPVGGLPDVVRGLSPTLVLPASGAAPLADALGAALRGTLALPSEAACRRFAASRYDWSVVAEQTRAVYDDVT